MSQSLSSAVFSPPPARRAASRPAMSPSLFADGRIEVTQYACDELPPAEAASVNALLVQLLERQPERVDLWQMRFDVCHAQQMVEGFAIAVCDARERSSVSAQLDWAAIERQWQALSPGQPLPRVRPGVIELRSHAERFHDCAPDVAGQALAVLGREYQALRQQPDFHARFLQALSRPLQRGTPLVPAAHLLKGCGSGVRLFLKREDRRRVAPEFENALAQAWVARALGKQSLVAANEHPAHALALAAVSARLRMPCTLFLSREDFLHQVDLVVQLQARGVDLQIVPEDDPRSAALSHWVARHRDAHLVLLGAGPDPYPDIIGDFQSLLARETAEQYTALVSQPPPRRSLIAGMESRADALGFLLDPQPQLARVCVTPALPTPPQAGRWSGAYRARRREHATLRASGQVTYLAVEDEAMCEAQAQLKAAEGIDLAAEEARPLALALHRARTATAPQDFIVLIA